MKMRVDFDSEAVIIIDVDGEDSCSIIAGPKIEVDSPMPNEGAAFSLAELYVIHQLIYQAINTMERMNGNEYKTRLV